MPNQVWPDSSPTMSVSYVASASSPIASAKGSGLEVIFSPLPLTTAYIPSVPDWYLKLTWYFTPGSNLKF